MARRTKRPPAPSPPAGTTGAARNQAWRLRGTGRDQQQPHGHRVRVAAVLELHGPRVSASIKNPGFSSTGGPRPRSWGRRRGQASRPRGEPVPRRSASRAGALSHRGVARSREPTGLERPQNDGCGGTVPPQPGPFRPPLRPFRDQTKSVRVIPGRLDKTLLLSPRDRHLEWRLDRVAPLLQYRAEQAERYDGGVAGVGRPDGQWRSVEQGVARVRPGPRRVLLPANRGPSPAAPS